MQESGSDLQRLVSTAIVFKGNKKREDIEREFNATEYYHRLLGNLVAEPVSLSPFFEDSPEGGFWCLDLRHGGITLSDLVKSGKASYADFSEAVSLLAKLHHYGMEGYKRGELSVEDIVNADTYADIFGVVKRNKEEGCSIHFTRRIEDIFFNQLGALGKKIEETVKHKFLLHYRAINNVLAAAETTVYTDANWRNFVKSLAGVISKIDFEKLRFYPAQNDLVNLLEFGIFLSEEERKRLINQYIAETEFLTKKRIGKIDKKAFLRIYEFAAVQRHLELAGYRARDWAEAEDNASKEENLRAQAYHYRAAQFHLEEIVKFAEGEQKEALLRLGAAFQELNLFEGDSGIEALLREQKKRKHLQTPLKVALAAVAILTTIAGIYVFNQTRIEDMLETSKPKVYPAVIVKRAEALQRTKLAFVLEKETPELYVINPVSSEVNKIGDAKYFSWMPNSNRLAYVDIKEGDKAGIKSSLNMIDFDTGLKITFPRKGYERLTRLDFSSLGVIAIEFNSDIYLADPDTLSIQPLVESVSKTEVFNPVWSPDGEYLTFLSAELKPGTETRARLYAVDKEGRALKKGPLLRYAPFPYISWSPDSQRIAFVSLKEDKYKIYIADKDFSNIVDLYETAETSVLSISVPQWISNTEFVFASSEKKGSSKKLYKGNLEGFVVKLSSDWRYSEALEAVFPGLIIYSTRGVPSQEGRIFPDLYAMDFNGYNNRSLTNSPQRDFLPISLDGKHIFYLTESPGEPTQVNIISVDGTGRRAIATLP